MRWPLRLLAIAVVAGALLLLLRAPLGLDWQRRVAPSVPAPSLTSILEAPPRHARHGTDGLVSVRGRVVTLAGDPVGGATVVLARPAEDAEPFAEVEADGAGGFEARVPPGEIRALASAPGFLAGAAFGSAPGEAITIALAGEAMLVGRVVRADTGEPVVDASVEIDGDNPLEDAVHTGPDGRFRSDGLMPGRYLLVASALGLHGRMAKPTLLVAGQTSEEITIAVGPVATLRGRLVLAATGAPCPDGEVMLDADGMRTLSATADATGEVVFPALPAGRYEPLLTCAGHASSQRAPEIEIGARSREVRFAVNEEIVLAGVVVDPHGTPLGGVHITVERRDGPAEPHEPAVVSSDGDFELRGLEPGTYALYAERRDGMGPREVLHPVTLAFGKRSPELRIVLQRAEPLLRLAGHVVDEQGQPVTAAEVEIERAGTPTHVTNVDADGRFDTKRLTQGPVRLVVSTHDMRSLPIVAGEAELTLPIDHEITLTVAAPPRGRIEGRVLREGPAGERVTIFARIARRGVVDMKRVGDDGRFSLTVPLDEDCSLEAGASSGEVAEVEHVRAGAQVDLQLRRGAVLRGVVRGAPEVFRVEVEGGAGVYGGGSVRGTGGAWQIRGLPAGEATVTLDAPGFFARTKVTLVPGETRTIDLQLAPKDDDPGDDDAPDP